MAWLRAGRTGASRSLPPLRRTPRPSPSCPRRRRRPATSSAGASTSITSDVIVRNDGGQFVANLAKNDFEVYEDGVKQDVVTFVLTHGGRVFNDIAAPAPPPMEGMLLPPPRPTNDAAGRIFLIFVDDLHLDFRNTGRIRELFKKIGKELIHDGDMFGIVSTGPSSIAIDMTYDHKRLDEAMNKISGAGLKPTDIIDTPDGSQGPPEVRYRAHVAFSTVYDILKKLEQVHNRRKAFIYVSDGYDFDPFAKSRAKANARAHGHDLRQHGPGLRVRGLQLSGGNGDSSGSSDTNPFATNKQSNEFAFADLASELAELTREANRANATLYTIDPRGLVGGPDLDEKGRQVEWQNHIRETQNSLRVLAEQTGGYRGRQLERLRQGAEADRCRDERLLCFGLLLQQSGSHKEAPCHRDPRKSVRPLRSEIQDFVYAEAAAAAEQDSNARRSSLDRRSSARLFTRLFHPSCYTFCA